MFSSPVPDYNNDFLTLSCLMKYPQFNTPHERTEFILFVVYFSHFLHTMGRDKHALCCMRAHILPRFPSAISHSATTRRERDIFFGNHGTVEKQINKTKMCFGTTEAIINEMRWESEMRTSVSKHHYK